MNLFRNYIGIDYSGAKTPTESLKGLQVYATNDAEDPRVVKPPSELKRHWSRQAVAEYLITYLSGAGPTVVGIDHGFSFPQAYFERHGIRHDWDTFLNDFWEHWPTDDQQVYVDFVRDGVCGKGAARLGNSRWRRLTELRTRSAKSVFHFDCQGSVAKSTHAGIPWLRRLRHAPEAVVHFWPFDGWKPKAGVHVVAEVYPSLWQGRYPNEERTPDQQDAFTICRWLQETDCAGRLRQFFEPSLSTHEARIAKVEGWILGVE